jgi:hypothetical protein
MGAAHYYVALHFGKRTCKRVPDRTAHNRPRLTLKGLKAKTIETELTSVYDNEGLQIFAVKKW